MPGRKKGSKKSKSSSGRKTHHVNPYDRKDGVHVKGHPARNPKK